MSLESFIGYAFMAVLIWAAWYFGLWAVIPETAIWGFVAGWMGLIAILRFSGYR